MDRLSKYCSRHERGRIADQLHPFAGPYIVCIGHRARMFEQIADLGLASSGRRCRCRRRRTMNATAASRACHNPGVEHGGRNLDHAADRPMRVHDSAMTSVVMPFCTPATRPSGFKIRLNQLAGPARVIRLHQQKHDVERFGKGADIAKIIGADRCHLRFAWHVDADAVLPHGLDMLRPLVDQHDIEPGTRQIGADRRAVCAASENRDSLV